MVEVAKIWIWNRGRVEKKARYSARSYLVQVVLVCGIKNGGHRVVVRIKEAAIGWMDGWTDGDVVIVDGGKARAPSRLSTIS
jgi:hypothetical protein